MDLGVAGTIKTFLTDATRLNEWLSNNADEEIIDIKFSSTQENLDALIIYRKEVTR